jgi:hypothetical protein
VTEFVCAYCDVYCRVERIQYDDDGREIMCSSVCAYCGRSGLRRGKLGRQTPVPSAGSERPGNKFYKMTYKMLTPACC